MLETLQVVMECDAVGIFILNRDVKIAQAGSRRSDGMIAGIADRGFDRRPSSRDRMMTRGEGIVGEVILSGRPIIVRDVRSDSRYVVGRAKTQSEITLPILLNEHVIGALNLESDKLAAFDESDLDFLQFFADAVAVSLDKAMLHQKLLEKETTDRQLKIAAEVQSQLLPRNHPHIEGYDIAGLCLPTSEIGGDYYDYVPISDGRLGIALADVSGHGIPAALVMSAVRAMLRTKLKEQGDPAATAQFVNALFPEIAGSSDFVTAVIGVLEPRNGRFTYANCGHPPPLLCRGGRQVERLTSDDPALGVVETRAFGSRTADLLPGNVLVLYTDAVIESANGSNEAFGDRRLENAIIANASAPIEQIMRSIVDAVHSHTGRDSCDDDFTLVLVKRADALTNTFAARTPSVACVDPSGEITRR